jgi:hypothetical protein
MRRIVMVALMSLFAIAGNAPIHSDQPQWLNPGEITETTRDNKIDATKHQQDQVPTTTVLPPGYTNDSGK